MKRDLKNKKYHYFYRIENIINNYYYYGIHSTNNIDDGYMGSGRALKRALKLYGIENFTKTILKYFNTREECSNYEALVVNELCITDPMCYNVVLGGDTGLTNNTLLVIDKNNVYHRVTYNDEKYLNGEYKPFSLGKTAAYDILDEKYVWISKELFNLHKNERYIGCSKGNIVVKDKNNKFLSVSINDERYINGELIPIFSNMKHSEETKNKMKQIFALHKHQLGEKNSLYGTMWVYNKNTLENKKIKKEELVNYPANIWIIGRYVDKTNIKLKLEDKITIDELKRLKDEHKSWETIARELNVSRSTLNRYRKKFNI